MLDLDVYRTGGQAILNGGSLYAIRAADNLPFTYPPVSAVLAVPLALVPFDVAKVGWMAMLLGSLLLAVQAGFRPLLRRASGAAAVVLPVVLAVSAYLLPGFAAARACWQRGKEMAAITITGLLGALLSPVAWIHHLCWVTIAIGVIAAPVRMPGSDPLLGRRIFPGWLFEEGGLHAVDLPGLLRP